MNAPLFLLNASMLLFPAGIATLSALFSSGVSFLRLLTTFLIASFVLVSIYFRFLVVILSLCSEASASSRVHSYYLFSISSRPWSR